MPHKEKRPFRFRLNVLDEKAEAPQDTYHLQVLLSKFGFLTNPYRPGEYDETTRDAVAQFQSFYRLPNEDDGIAGPETLGLLLQKRCGVVDLTPPHAQHGLPIASYVTVASWPKAALTYRFLNVSPDLDQGRQQDIVHEAFQRWQDSGGLTFSESPPGWQTDLSIAFHRGSHGDGNPFDDQGGPDGNTLAHAFFPPPAGGTWAGSLHFDEYEQWKDVPGGPGIRLYNVALHEIGHLIGLSHSQDPTAIMYAYYAEDRNDLRPDDAAGVQSLYGAPASAPESLTPGQRVIGTLGATDAEQAYQVTVQNKLLVKLEGPAEQDFDIYVRHGQPVDRAQQNGYDAYSYGVTANELVTIEDPKPGPYYILVHSYRGGGAYTLDVKVT